MTMEETDRDVIFVEGVTRSLRLSPDAWGRENEAQMVNLSARVFWKIDGSTDDVKKTLDYSLIYHELVYAGFAEGQSLYDCGMQLALAVKSPVTSSNVNRPEKQLKLSSFDGEVIVSLPKATVISGAILSLTTKFSLSEDYPWELSLTNAVLYCTIGVLPMEQARKQPIVVSVTLRDGLRGLDFDYENLAPMVEKVCSTTSTSPIPKRIQFMVFTDDQNAGYCKLQVSHAGEAVHHSSPFPAQRNVSPDGPHCSHRQTDHLQWM
jgi:dihydroneopterin aldolase